MQTEDHPVEYCQFEGVIPKKEYGGGSMIVWDGGLWEPLDEDVIAAFRRGHLRFILHGQKLEGRWDLFKIKGKEDKENTWFLKKFNDNFAISLKQYDVTEKFPQSILSGKKVEEITEAHEPKQNKKPALNLPSTSLPKTLSPKTCYVNRQST